MKNKTIKKIAVLTLSAILMVFVQSCSTSRTFKGGAIGAGTGGAIGGVIGNKSGNTAQGAIIGAMIGGTAGALIGKYMDNQAKELEDDLENAKVERVGEGIRIVFDSGILFDFDSDALRGEARKNLDEFAKTLDKYDDTEILIEGHTDNKGTDDYNENLSIKRAQSVSDYLKNKSVSRSRLTVKGYGESQPTASNDTETGRQQNRRVEIAIYANNKLKKDAKKGNL